MIETIIIKNLSSFGESEQSINNLKKINFFYGSNGSGKTTISRVMQNHEQYPDCQLFWKANRPVKIFVYNRDFIDKNFSTNQELARIFTLGENDTNIQVAIVKAKKEREDILTKINKTLDGGDEDIGEKAALKELEDEFKKACWEYYTKFQNDFNCFSGYADSKEKFKKDLLEEVKKYSRSIAQ